jgi:hypothetical protein
MRQTETTNNNLAMCNNQYTIIYIYIYIYKFINIEVVHLDQFAYFR